MRTSRLPLVSHQRLQLPLPSLLRLSPLLQLQLAHVIGLFVVALDDIDALRRTFLLADFARHAAQSRMLIVPIENQERKISVILRKWTALLRILHRGQAFLLEITSDKVPRRD